MANNAKPLPRPDALTERFWASVGHSAMEIQRCDDCSQYVFYPRAHCPHCASRSLQWKAVSGRGTLYSFTIVHRAGPPFKADLPFVVAIVELEEGCRMLTNLIGVPPDPARIRIGMSVAIDYAAAAEMALPKFRPL